MWTGRYVLEHMLPEEWDAADNDKSQRINNCGIIWYTRVDPTNALKSAPYLKWRRMIYPDNPSQSPYGGEWVELPGKRQFTGAELLESVERIRPLFPRLIEAAGE